MRETQVYANKRKCFFQQKRVPYLGHYISKKGIEMDPKKISAVIEWPKITTITQLRGFLGLIGFYRKFIKDFANIALPLTKLLKESTTFNWTEEQDKAREILIKALTSGPILTTPQKGVPLELATDASNEAMGAVISCGGRPIAFTSKKFSESQVKWPIYQKEYYAIYWAFLRWEYWL
jgi:hypothetical protein